MAFENMVWHPMDILSKIVALETFTHKLNFKHGNRERITHYHSPFSVSYCFYFLFSFSFSIHIFMLPILTTFSALYLILTIQGGVKGLILAACNYHEVA